MERGFVKGTIEELFKLKENRSKEEAAKLAIMRLVELTKNKIVEVNRKYFVSEWSWTPIADGIYVYEETISDCRDFGEVKAYCTGNNCRTYLPWDIYEAKEDCELITDFKNSFGYTWDMEQEMFLSNIGAHNTMGKWL